MVFCCARCTSSWDWCSVLYYLLTRLTAPRPRCVGEYICSMLCLPTKKLLAAYKVASDASIDANTQLALKAGQLVHEATGKRVAVLVPDGPEYERSSKLFKTSLEMSDGVDMGHLFEGREPVGKVRLVSSSVLLCFSQKLLVLLHVRWPFQQPGWRRVGIYRV